MSECPNQLLLSLSILSGIFYYYCSAKWTKLAWGESADMFDKKVTEPRVEKLLDRGYFLMIFGFVLGLGAMIIYMVTFTANV